MYKFTKSAAVVAVVYACALIGVQAEEAIPSDRGCASSLCPTLNKFPKCTPRWYQALQACYDPPCNIRYIRDPAADCKKTPLRSRDEAVVKKCENTLCPRLSDFPDCSKEWYQALQACYDPPCNYRYLVDPAQHCTKTTKPCYTQTVFVSGRCPPIIPPPGGCVEPDCIIASTTTVPCKNTNCPATPTVTSTAKCPPTKGTCRHGCATATLTATATC